jgi:3-oxoacyl-[acyl-carrier protein] reductase
LVNNAGQIIRPGYSEVINEEDWDRTFKINAYGYFNCVSSFLPSLKKSSCGRIINIASTYGLKGDAGVIAYCAAKAAVINMTISLAKELAPNVTVNAVAPGNIDTDMTRGAGNEFINEVVKSTPLRRLGDVIDVANVVEFLASNKASFLTGITINVDGGFSLVN